MDGTGKEDIVALTPQDLAAYLRVLREANVREFSGLGLCVVFTPEVPDMEQTESDPPPRNIWEHKTLWPGGKPPTFPGSK